MRRSIARATCTVDGQHRARARAERRAGDPVILGALDERGIAVASVTTARPSLDDVYLHYTGRDFATEDEEGSR